MRAARGLVIVLASLVFVLPLYSQGTNAVLSGTVTDPTQAFIPGAQITIQNVSTGVTSTALTNEAGIYNFPSMQPGIYRATAELPGFKKYIYNGVNLEVGSRVVLNFQLEVGAAVETGIEVTAQMDAAQALGTSTVGTVLEGKRITDLPLPA